MPKISELSTVQAVSVSDADLIPIVNVSTTKSVTRAGLLNAARVAGHDWRPSPAIGAELWTLANFQFGYNTTEIAPSLTANSSDQTLRTRIKAGNLLNRDSSFRLSFNVSSVPANGWYYVDVRLTDTGGTLLAGTNAQTVVNASSPFTGEHVFEFKPDADSVTGDVFVELQLHVVNNATSGTLTVSDCSLVQTAYVTRPLYYSESYLGSPGYPTVWVQQFSPPRRQWNVTGNDIAADGDLTRALAGCGSYGTPRPFGTTNAIDPTFADVTVGSLGTIGYPQPVLSTGVPARIMRGGNNDQIIEVLKQDGVTYELRCNTHGGETLRSSSSPDLVYEYDLIGDGTWVATTEPFGKFLRPAHRFRWTWNTQVARSAPDSDVIANVDHRTVFFPDGIIRTDRTTTFTKSLTLRNVFEWMCSHDNTKPQVGRVGRGLFVLAEVDTYVRLGTPVAPTPSTSASGGTLAAGTYWYRLSAMTEGGETVPSAVAQQVTTGATSTATLTWSAITGATGYRVYGRANDTGRSVLLVTLNASATTWTDDGSISANGQGMPVVNTARRMDQPTTVVLDSAIHCYANFAVWRDLQTGLCHASIWDRDAISARAGVTGGRVRLSEGGGIAKTYVNLMYNGADTINVDSSTVWTATHWLFTYMPSSESEWHLEAASKSMDLAALKSRYPAS